jgi:hypothetical protein
VSEYFRFLIEGYPKSQSIVQVLASDDAPHDIEEARFADCFMRGIQWEPWIEEGRRKNGRPCLVVNRMDCVKAHILASSERADCTLKNLSRLDVILVRRLAEHQRLFNYFYSSWVDSRAWRGGANVDAMPLLIGLQESERNLRSEFGAYNPNLGTANENRAAQGPTPEAR